MVARSKVPVEGRCMWGANVDSITPHKDGEEGDHIGEAVSWSQGPGTVGVKAMASGWQWQLPTHGGHFLGTSDESEPCGSLREALVPWSGTSSESPAELPHGPKGQLLRLWPMIAWRAARSLPHPGV